MNLPVLADWLTLIFAPIVIVCAFLIWRAQRSVRGVEGAVSALGRLAQVAMVVCVALLAIVRIAWGS
ncbi:hypothetical protein ACFMQL_31065 [Nonomuraea fastidiosa]|uniref:hypothetical protein n=1 Tax=Nonomuraea TaxID=83681 RepID=UPI003249AFBD